MAEYERVSAFIYSILLLYAAAEDIHVYSIDESFIDCTAYLHAYEEEALRQKKRDLVRDFALKEAPLTWEALQTLESECETVKAQVAELKKTLESFNKNAEADNDFIAARQKLRDMNQARDTLWKAMERAYIQYCKFKASAGDAELAELSRNATTAAIKEAGAAKERYRAMVQEK